MSASPIVAWLDARASVPPASLVSALHEIAAESRDAVGSTAGGDVCDTMLQVSVRVLRQLLAEAQTSRESALQLLAADALVTYAFEAAADAPESLDARCRAAMRRFAEVVDGS